MSRSASSRAVRLRELAVLFLKLGTVGFGGPAAHVAMMEEEVVRRRGWMTRERFLDLWGATFLIPGPNSTEMAIHIGHERAGWCGLLVAGTAFILPAFLIVLAFAWGYRTWGNLPELAGILAGVEPVVFAVVVQALFGLARSAFKNLRLTVLGVAAFVASAAGLHELVVLLATGVAAVALSGRFRPSPAAAVFLPAAGAPALIAAAAPVPFAFGTLFWTFAKIGSVLFGSGYVLLAFLRTDLVERLGWITEAQLLDALAVGQVTPGPLFTTATFIGFLVGGGVGAVLATAGIFLPAFVFVAASGPLVPRLRASPTAGALLDGVNVASLALMARVTGELARTALATPLALLLTLASAALLLGTRMRSAWLLPAGALLGWLTMTPGAGATIEVARRTPRCRGVRRRRTDDAQTPDVPHFHTRLRACQPDRRARGDPGRRPLHPRCRRRRATRPGVGARPSRRRRLPPRGDDRRPAVPRGARLV